MPEAGLIINHMYDFVPDRTDDRFLFCPVCDPQVFFCPIGKPGVLTAHFVQTGHDTVKLDAAHGVPEMQALGAVKALSCKRCGFTAASKSALMKHVWEHKRTPAPTLDVTVLAPVPPAPTVANRVKTFLNRLP